MNTLPQNSRARVSLATRLRAATLETTLVSARGTDRPGRPHTRERHSAARTEGPSRPAGTRFSRVQRVTKEARREKRVTCDSIHTMCENKTELRLLFSH